MVVSIKKVQSESKGLYERYEITDGSYKYNFNRVVSSTTGENAYRIVKLTKNYTAITNPGNWEKAFALTGHDLVGGMHGHEKFVSLYIVKDTEHINPYLNTVYSGSKIIIVQNSDIYNPAMKDQIICRAVQTYTFENNKLTINTKYNWKITYTLETFYNGMFPSNQNVFKYGLINGYTQETLVNNNGEFTTEKTSAKGTVWNNNNTIIISMESNTSGPAWIKCSSAYNKLYLARVYEGSMNITKGTTTEVNTIYRII